MAGVLDRLLKNSTIEHTNTIPNSKFFKPKDFIQTQVPMVNVAFSGRLDGGLSAGLSIFAAPSKHFKTAFLMLCLRAYFDKYKDGVCLFYDNENGAPAAYFEAFGIDTSRVVHTPVKNIEVLKFDIVNQFEGLTSDDRVIVLVDSLGNLASKKELEDAKEGKSVADMTRAKEGKALVRVLNPYLMELDIPMVAAGHTYKEMSLFPKDIMSGGTGYYYYAQNIFFVSRSQDKNDKTKEIEGWNFKLTVEKSRYVMEKKQVSLEVSYDEGINPWSGLLDVAIESGHVTNETQGWYQRKGEDEKYRKDDTNTKEFWAPILQDQTFQQYIKDSFQLAKGNILQNLDLDDETDSPVVELPEISPDSFASLKGKSKRAK